MMLSAKQVVTRVGGPAPVLRSNARASVRARAATEEKVSKQEASGYVEYDSAGQSNMYPVMQKPYEASATDAFSGSNAFVAFGALAVAAVIVGGGAAALLGSPSATVATPEDLVSLSTYAAKFAAEL